MCVCVCVSNGVRFRNLSKGGLAVFELSRHGKKFCYFCQELELFKLEMSFGATTLVHTSYSNKADALKTHEKRGSLCGEMEGQTQAHCSPNYQQISPLLWCQKHPSLNAHRQHVHHTAHLVSRGHSPSSVEHRHLKTDRS